MTINSPVRLLDWDSTFFGVRIGRIEATRLTQVDIAAALQWASNHGVECLYFLCVADDDESVRLAEAQEFHLVDLRLTLRWRKDGRPTSGLLRGDESVPVVRPYRPEDKIGIEDIAAVAYHDTRFFYDRNIGVEHATALYREWAAKSCDGAVDAVLVAADSQVVQGFITCQLQSPRHGQIGLVGVHEESRGAGLGQMLVEAALAYFVDKGVDSVEVVTQGRNIAAQRLYQKCGFRSHSLHLWYPRWFNA